MKKMLFSLLLALPLLANADTYNYLNINSTSTAQSVALKTVKKITFEGTNLVVTATDGTVTTAALATLSNLTFSDIATSVRSTKSQTGQLCIEAGRVVADGNGLLQLYNAGGQLVRSKQVNGIRSELNLDGLPHGIYIARLGNRTIKVLH